MGPLIRNPDVNGPVVAPAESNVVYIDISVHIYVFAESSSGTVTAIPVALNELLLLPVIGFGS